MQPALQLVAAGVLALLGTLLPVTGIVAVAVWVYDDARHRDSDSPGLWGVGTAVLPLVLPAYLLVVGLGRLGERRSLPATRERVAGSYGFGVLLALLVAGLFGPPDPTSQTLYTVAALLPAVVVAYVLLGRDRKA